MIRRVREMLVGWASALAGHHDYVAAVRSLRRAPAFVAISVLSLGIAIGVNGTTFAMLDAVLDPFVPYPHAEQLLTLRTYGWGAAHIDLTPEMLGTVLARRDLFSETVPWTPAARYQTLEIDGQSTPGHVVVVAPGFVHALGIALLRGRGFAPYASGEPDASSAIVSFSVWRQQLGSNPDLDHLSVTLGGEQHPVVGVMPAGVDYLNGAQVWLRMPSSMAQSFVGTSPMQSLVRLHSGDTRERVQSLLDAYALRVAGEHALPSNMTAIMTSNIMPRTNGIFGYDSALAVASFLVLLVACLNVANVMLARGIARRREIAVRVAIGASGGAIVRYVMAEAVLLATAGGVLGCTLAVWGVDLVKTWMPAEMLLWFFRIPVFNWHVLAFIGGMTGVTALLSGLWPALRARRADVGEAMKDGGAAVAGRASGVYRFVVSAQLVLSLVMAMAAAALLESLTPPPKQVSPINQRHLYNGTVMPSHAACRAMPHPERFASDLVAAIRGVPGVTAAGAAVWMRPERELVTSDQPSAPVTVVLQSYGEATPGYVRARGIPLVAGRDFEPGDLESGAAIVNLGLARHLWPLMSPVGRAIKLGPSESNAKWMRVVGVVSAPIELPDGERVDVAPALTLIGQSRCASATFFARVERDDPRIVGALYRGLRAALPGVTLSDVYGAGAGAAGATYTQKVIASTYTGVALFMLLLSAAGVYGVMSLVVGQRTREFAVRVALGASGRELLRLVMRDAWIMALAGIGIGAFVAMHFSPYGGLSVHLMDTDPIALVVAEAAVVAATLLACVMPAMRASRVDPVNVLRSA